MNTTCCITKSIEIENEVNKFLIFVKRTLLSKPYKLDFVSRNCNRECLLSLDYNVEDVLNEILSLKYYDFVDMREDDNKAYSNERIFIFGKKIQDMEVYIKLKIKKNNSSIIILSFHEAKYSINYYFK